MTSFLGSGGRCHFARAAAELASSRDLLQGTFEKIHLHRLLRQSAVSRHLAQSSLAPSRSSTLTSFRSASASRTLRSRFAILTPRFARRRVDRLDIEKTMRFLAESVHGRRALATHTVWNSAPTFYSAPKPALGPMGDRCFPMARSSPAYLSVQSRCSGRRFPAHRTGSRRPPCSPQFAGNSGLSARILCKYASFRQVRFSADHSAFR